MQFPLQPEHACCSLIDSSTRGIWRRQPTIRVRCSRDRDANLAHNAISDTKWTNFEFGEKRLRNG